MTSDLTNNTRTAPIAARYDPLVSTGRGSYVFYGETSLEKLLASFDRAYPEYTDASRDDVIAGWKAADDMMNDVELLSLAEELKKAWDVERQYSSPDAEAQAFEAAYAVCDGLVKRILAIHAHTLRGFKAKALAVFWCHNGDNIDLDGDSTDMRLASGIINELLVA